MTSQRLRQIERLFHEARERAPAEREAFLVRACAGDSNLRAEVESLLEQPSAGAIDSPIGAVVADLITPAGPQLAPDAAVGPYRIACLLGAGAMGEVYRARDTRLDRDVAIKILPAGLAVDMERAARFQREAKVLASLNHPFIAAIYGWEDLPDLTAIVMELVEGEDLAQRLARGALSLEDALPIANQIAEALEAAHEQGIIHRDLKPANIKLRPDGTVKVLDFGLAKVFDTTGASPSATTSPMISMLSTRPGIILGTAAYMSPEQAKGKPVDKRADIWSFGCILFEMLAGRRPFEGETISDVLAKIIERDPDWKALSRSTPTYVRHLLERCLQKDPKRRLRDIGDAIFELETRDGGGEVDRTLPNRKIVTWIVGATLASTVLTVGFIRRTREPELPDSRPLRVPLQPGPDATNLDAGPFALSRDGSQMVYRERGASGRIQLVIRALDRDEVTPLPGTDGGTSPFFSPDGRSVGFFADGRLKQISLRGGSPVDVFDAPGEDGATWTDDGDIVAARNSVLYRVPATGGAPRAFTTLAGEVTDRWPQAIPGAKAVIFTASALIGDFEHATIEVQSLETGRRQTLVRDAYFGRYAASGHLLFVRRGTLYAVPFDVQTLETHGAPAPIVDGIATRRQRGLALFDLALDGTFVYDREPDEHRLAWLTADGRVQPLRAAPARYDYGLRISPDGTRLAFGMPAAAFDVWTYDWARDAMMRVTFGPANENHPVWSPDGKYLAYSCSVGLRPPGGKICWTAANGAGDEVVLIESDVRLTPYSFSPDGRWMAFG